MWLLWSQDGGCLRHQKLRTPDVAMISLCAGSATVLCCAPMLDARRWARRQRRPRAQRAERPRRTGSSRLCVQNVSSSGSCGRGRLLQDQMASFTCTRHRAA